MKIGILGFGLQGQSAAKYWGKDSKNSITICDENEALEVPKNVQAKLGKDYLSNLDKFDLIVRSPSVHPNDVVAANNARILDKVTTNTNEFLKVCTSKNIIGVTGTKGKGTTATLIAEMLNKAGCRVHLGGNIGTPPLDMLKDGVKPDDWVVLELANFQLIDLKYSPKIAVCVSVFPEHLDWHEDKDEYIDAKKQLFAHQKSDDIAIYYAKNDNSKAIASASPGQKIPYYAPPGAFIENDDVVINGQSICSTSDIKLPGEHNWQNVCAAVTAIWQITQDAKAIRSGVIGLASLPHRLELVREIGEVKYYDDSFGTTPETAIAALEAFSQPKVIILGGSDKGVDFAELAKTIKNSNVRKAVLIGETAGKIGEALKKAGFTDYIDGGNDIAQIVQTAREAARPGDIVLLSPACASFGLFKNYEDRGAQFQAAVKAL